MMIKERSVADFKIAAVSSISAMNVETPRSCRTHVLAEGKKKMCEIGNDMLDSLCNNKDFIIQLHSTCQPAFTTTTYTGEKLSRILELAENCITTVFGDECTWQSPAPTRAKMQSRTLISAWSHGTKHPT
jgi:hypothetical protein